jgi:hypothetical protein
MHFVSVILKLKYFLWVRWVKWTWRVHELGRDDGAIVLDLSRSLGTERQTVRLIPRTSASELAQEVELARLLRANEIAKLLESNFAAFRIVRIALNESNGRMANILIESPNKEHTAVLADVTNGLTAENLLACMTRRMCRNPRWNLRR